MYRMVWMLVYCMLCTYIISYTLELIKNTFYLYFKQRIFNSWYFNLFIGSQTFKISQYIHPL
jgi:hypothetical protein